MRCRNRNYRQRPVVAKPPPQGLMPLSSKLIDWDTLKLSSLSSVMPDEGEQRAGLIEEYLWGYITILKEKNSDRAAIQDRELSSFLQDEAEERRFMTEDGDHFALRSFISVTEQTGVDLIVSWEKTCRSELMKQYKEYLAEAFAILEEIHRMHVSSQAFDSVFLKLCQLNPYWMWRKLKFVEEEKEVKAFTAQREALVREERVERQKKIEEYNRMYTLAVELLAFTEKVDVYQKHEIIFTDSCRVIFEDSAIKIQAAFRGFLVRKHVHWW